MTTTNATVINQVLEKSVPKAKTEERERRIQKRQEQLLGVTYDLHSILPIEKQELEPLLTESLKFLTTAVSDPGFEEKYMRLSLDVLKLRNKNSLPSLSPFSILSPEFVFIQKAWHWMSPQFETRPLLPPPMMSCYSDINQMMKVTCQTEANKTRKTIQQEFRVKYRGVIPKSVREAVEKARVDFGTPITKKTGIFTRKTEVTGYTYDNIFLLAEVENWEKREMRIGDPIVVGYKGGFLWVIDVFDITPAEEHVLREFVDWDSVKI